MEDSPRGRSAGGFAAGGTAEALATLSSRQAHDFVIVVLDGGMPADLTGMQPWLSRSCRDAQACKRGGQCAGQRGIRDAAEDRLRRAGRRKSIILSLMDEDGNADPGFTGCDVGVMEDSTGHDHRRGKLRFGRLPASLAQFDACKAAASAANTAAGRGPFRAASGAQKVANDAKEARQRGNLSARKARKARKATPAHRDRGAKKGTPASGAAGRDWSHWTRKGQSGADGEGTFESLTDEQKASLREAATKGRERGKG